MIKSQRNLHRRLAGLVFDRELIPLLHAEISALKGRLYAMSRKLVSDEFKSESLARLLSCARSAKKHAAALQLQLGIIGADSYAEIPSGGNSSTLQMMLNEAQDEHQPVSLKPRPRVT